MTSRDDLPPEMRRQWLDGDTRERLLAGRVDPDDAPPGYAEVARVLGAAAAPFDPADLGQEAEHVAAARMLITRRSPALGRFDGRSRRMRTKGDRLRLVGVVVLGTLLGTSGLAAAGVLPDSAQDMLSHVLDRVGISVPMGHLPDSSGGPSEHPASSGEPSEHPASSGEPSEHPASSGGQISEIATTTDSTGVGKGAEISSIASGGMSQAGEHGSAEHGTAEHGNARNGTDKAPVSTPNTGGTGTADAASGGHSDAHTDIADQNSDGRSAAGAGNGSGPPSVPPSPGSTH
jgi:hypothetical protein